MVETLSFTLNGMRAVGKFWAEERCDLRFNGFTLAAEMKIDWRGSGVELERLFKKILQKKKEEDTAVTQGRGDQKVSGKIFLKDRIHWKNSLKEFTNGLNVGRNRRKRSEGWPSPTSPGWGVTNWKKEIAFIDGKTVGRAGFKTEVGGRETQGFGFLTCFLYKTVATIFKYPWKMC